MRNILNKRNSRYCFTCFVMWLLLGLGHLLRFSHPGFLHKEIKVNKLRNQERIFKVTLTEEFVKFPDVINGPYDTKDKASYLGSAATVYTDQVSSLMGTTILPSLQGRLPGLDIVRTRGARKSQIESSSSVKRHIVIIRNLMFYHATMHRWW